MSTHKHIDRICLMALLLALAVTLLFINVEKFGIQVSYTLAEYESKLFDTSYVHTVNIIMDDWDDFIADCASEEYAVCTVVIDNETYHNVAIRGKGNTSLTQVAAYGNGRYSFKIEFDHYDRSNSYYGLDKLCLNNIIQDNTYMKDYLTYQMMNFFGVASPLCSYAAIMVNGEDFGLYLAVEGVEEAFLNRNYGKNYGELYKPDSQNMGSSDLSLIYTDDEYSSYSNIFDNAKTDITDSDKDRLIASLKKLNANEDISDTVDVDIVIRYFVVHNFVLNFDSYTGSMIHNYYLYEKEGKLSMIPWDYNLAFGGFESMSDAESLVNYPIDSPVSGGTIEDRPMLAWIFADEEYTVLYHEYFSEFIETYFGSGYFEEMIASVTALISPYVEKDPTKFCTYEEFEAGVKTLEDFCLLRAESVRGQLDGTIASTSEAQSQNTGGLIEADGITIAAMGSMNNNMEAGGVPEDMGNPDPGGMPPDQNLENSLPQDASGNTAEEESSSRAAPGQPGDLSPGMEQPGDLSPGMEQPVGSSAIDSANETGNRFVILGISVGILILGLAAAFLFKGRY